MERKNTQDNFTPENIQGQVVRIQEMLYEFIKGLSELKRNQDYFTEKLENPLRRRRP